MYLEILTPQQVISYQEWLQSNRTCIDEIITSKKRRIFPFSVVTNDVSLTESGLSSVLSGSNFTLANGSARVNASLEQICICLEESLKISKTKPQFGLEGGKKA